MVSLQNIHTYIHACIHTLAFWKMTLLMSGSNTEQSE